MEKLEEKKALVEDLANYIKALNVKKLYEEPDHKTSKDWLSEIAAILKYLDEGDYRTFLNYRQHLYLSIPQETRKHAAEQIDGFVRQKLAEFKRDNFEVEEQSTIYIKQEITEALIEKQDGFDYKKLIRLIKELNSNYASGYPYSSAMIIRALLDHIPPLLGHRSFEEVVNNYAWSQTDKEYMKKLLDFKNEGHDALHRQISNNPDLLEMDSIPTSNRINRLLQECITSGVGFDPLTQHQPSTPQKQKLPNIKIKILKDKISWANYSSDFPRGTWSSFMVELEIDNYNSSHPDYLTFTLQANIRDGKWTAGNFIILSTKPNDYRPNQPVYVEGKRVEQITILISDSEFGTPGQRLMPDLDKDTLELIVKTRSGQELHIPTKA
jgi:hypothetical protein